MKSKLNKMITPLEIRIANANELEYQEEYFTRELFFVTIIKGQNPIIKGWSKRGFKGTQKQYDHIMIENKKYSQQDSFKIMDIGVFESYEDYKLGKEIKNYG